MSGLACRVRLPSGGGARARRPARPTLMLLDVFELNLDLHEGHSFRDHDQ